MTLKLNLHIYIFNYLFVKKSLHIKKVAQVFKTKTDFDVNIKDEMDTLFEIWEIMRFFFFLNRGVS